MVWIKEFEVYNYEWLVCGMNLKVWGWGLGIRVKNNEFKIWV
jgi:hypothetical protein